MSPCAGSNFKYCKNSCTTDVTPHVETSVLAFAFHANLGDLELARTPVCATATHTWRRTQSSRRERCWQPAAHDWMDPCRCHGGRRGRVPCHKGPSLPGQGRHRRSGLRWSPHPGSARDEHNSMTSARRRRVAVQTDTERVSERTRGEA